MGGSLSRHPDRFGGALQMGRQLHEALVAHMQRFSFSATGALQWKRDVSEYLDWVRTLRAPLLDEKFQELQVPVAPLEMTQNSVEGKEAPCGRGGNLVEYISFLGVSQWSWRTLGCTFSYSLSGYAFTAHLADLADGTMRRT